MHTATEGTFRYLQILFLSGHVRERVVVCPLLRLSDSEIPRPLANVMDY
jgi:hypothetical protein